MGIVCSAVCGHLTSGNISVRVVIAGMKHHDQKQVAKSLGHCPVSVKRRHDQGKSYKRKHLIGACLQFQRFSLLSWWGELASRQTRCWRSVAKGSTCGSAGRESLSLAEAFESAKPTPSDTLPCKRSHLKILSNSVTPW